MNEKELFNYVLKGNGSAHDLISMLAFVSQIWDDIYDQDNELNRDDVNTAFIYLLTVLPKNQFYNAHFTEIQPLIESAIIDWMTANKYEQERNNLNIAWTIRDNLASVLIGMAKILGGMEWAVEVSPMIREFVHNEPLEDYINEHERRK
jgi:hypothetical protein